MEEFGTMFIDDENIYEVTVGNDPKNDVKFTLDKSYLKNTPKEVTVVGFVFDHNMLVQYGVTRLIVYTKNINGEISPWKDLINVPLTITSKV
jgi:hypothetical protein